MTTTRTVSDTLASAISELSADQVLTPAEARIDCLILLGCALGVKRAYLIAHPERMLTDAEISIFLELLQRRLSGEPIAYILGEKEFYGHMFRVTPDVLIPRPDTELLVELALQHLPTGQACRVLDLGTGSGAIAISIALQRPAAQVTAVDQSLAALQIAQENAARLSAANVTFLESNWFSQVEGVFDLIVSNPPYIADSDPHLAQGDVRFEPTTALIAGAKGLDCIQSIVEHAPIYLCPGGWLLFEHGFDQAEACQTILEKVGFQEIGIARDLAGITRVSSGRKTP